MLSISRNVRQRVAIAAVVIVGLGVLLLIAPYLGGLLLALVLNVLVSPMYQRLTKHVSPGLASTVVIVSIIGLIVVPTVWLVSVVVVQLPDAIRAVQDTGLLASLRTLHIGPIDVGSRIEGLSRNAEGWVVAQATSILGNAASSLLDLIISLFALYYLLQSDGSTWRAVRPFIPFSDEHAAELLLQFQSATRGTLLGSLLIAIMQGALVGVAFWVAGLSSAPLWGVVATVASIIPLFGSGIVWVPGVIALAAQHRYGAAISMLAFCGIVVASVDNLVRPIVSQRISSVHPMITLVGAFAGMSVFGLMGLILGPLSISYFFVLLRMYQEEYSPIAFDALAEDGRKTF